MMLASSRSKLFQWFNVFLPAVPALLMLTVLASPPEKPPLTPQDYGKWESFPGDPVVSADGKWMAYVIDRVNQERELRLRLLDADSERTVAWGENPLFSEDSNWVAWGIGVSEEERKRLEKEEKPVHLGAGLLRLGGEEQTDFQEVSRFSFDARGQFFAILGYAPEKPEGQGAVLRLISLQGQPETTFSNVGEYAWSEQGSLLAMTVATGKDEANGVQVFDAASGRLRSLHSSGSTYLGLSWWDEGAGLAFLRSLEPASTKGTSYTVLASRGLEGDEPVQLQLEPSASGVGEGLEISQHRTPGWSEDGSQVSLGLRPKKREATKSEESKPDEEQSQTEPKADQEEQKEEEVAGLQIWHSSDVRIFPQQKASEKDDNKRTLLAVWRLEENRVVQIGSDLMERAELLEGWEHALVRVEAPYPWGIMFGRPYHDVWAVTLATGARERVLQKTRYSEPSAGGRYVLSFDGEHYWSHDLRSGQRINITRDLATRFGDQEYDTPTDLLPPYRSGIAGWLENDEAVLLYDRYDVWRVAPDGSGGRRLTLGAEDEIEHWVIDLDPEEEAIKPSESLYFQTRSEWTEKQGISRLDPTSSHAEPLLFVDKRISGLQKAEHAEVLIYRSEARNDSPDYFAAGPMLSEPLQVTRTNPFQDDYAWTHSEFFEFQSESGRRLQAGLLYPVNHDPARRYPMIVYTYEILTPQVHRYEPPSERDYYNFTAWTQQGYFVLLPDIVYRPRDPGVSALESVRPAVAKVVEMGLVDGDRVGLIGHSWGGYQATYLPTRTHIFAASVAGAPLTDFVSFMGQIHWRPGNPEVDHWETGQARMEVPYWEDPEAHHRNSPIHKVHELETPLLMAFGSEDGVVDWDQGTEFYNFARRAGKQMVLLVYEGEGHGFRKEPNQIDYHRRILEWFGHYLKGEPAPDWITQGVALDELEKEKKRIAGEN